jgi:hypothetical protein
MKFNASSLIILVALFFFMCKSSKPSVSGQSTSIPPKVVSPATPPASESFGPVISSKVKVGVYEPGDKELAAIQSKYTDVSLSVLKNGYSIYTGVCTNCHNSFSIYEFPESTWSGIINRMAPLAKLTEVEKDAVVKYVLAIKATQPK